MGIKLEIPAYVNTALELLYDAGYEGYVVGGAVRDAVMGLEAHDYDITSSALPREIKDVFSSFRVIETGIKHGTVTVLIDDMPLEITTYRIDGEYSDRRRPDNVLFTSELKSDLSRRDFTCNALAYSPSEGVIDYFGGSDDIRNKIIRCVGVPEIRFEEDALRILRALRFSSVLGFDIDPETARAIHAQKNLLEYVSQERIFAELTKLICGKEAGRILRDYSDVIFFIIPELSAMKGCSQNHPRHIYDVWEHTIHSVDSIRDDPDLRLTMLFHDSGKPIVKTEDTDGINHFYSHAVKSAEIAEIVLKRFRSSNKIRNHVCKLIEYHGFTPDKLSPKTYKRYISDLGADTVKELFEVREADLRAQNPEYLSQSLKENSDGYKVFEEVLKKESCFSLKDLAVDGNDLLNLGFTESAYLGKVLSSLFDEVIDNRITNTKEALLERSKEYLNEN